METGAIAAALVIGLVIGGAIVYASILQYPPHVTTATSTSVSFSVSTVTSTVTSVLTTTILTYSIPPKFNISGSIDHLSGYLPAYISFQSKGTPAQNFTVSNNAYQGSLDNGLQYQVFMYAYFGTTVIGVPVPYGCGTLQDTVAWGSSTITANWHCA